VIWETIRLIPAFFSDPERTELKATVSAGQTAPINLKIIN
jgi:hypothetical protein